MSLRLLLVDDESAIRFAVADYFSARGYEVTTAADRADAEAALSETDYDVIIVDLSLDGGRNREGLEVIRHARRRNPQTPILLLTASCGADVVPLAVARGATQVLFKTMGLTEIREVVAALVPTEMLGRPHS